MTKKARKPNLPQETLERARREMYGAPAVEEKKPEQKTKPTEPAPVEPAPQVVFKPGVVRGTDLRQEYTYVLSDLQNMGILAGILLGILVVLSFFL
ncbi:MAG: hypothetical protein GYB65_03130 [Chloroflexi bacterium]|nr:hypothetical protein [Chloroflexota bacterium]